MKTVLNSAIPDFIRLDLFENEISLSNTINLGLVAPFDFELDAECWRWLPEGTSLFVTRTPRTSQVAVTVELAKQVSDEMAVSQAVGSLLAVKPVCVGYACTSGSFVSGIAGENSLRQTMLMAGSENAITTSGALIEALNYLKLKKIAIATPYNQQLTQKLVDFLNESGIDVISSGYMDMESGIATANHLAVKRLARLVDSKEAEAIFFSCTNLKTFDVIKELEEELDKPVLSANQVTMWSMMKRANITLPVLGQKLF